jgi:hypothetical protein
MPYNAVVELHDAVAKSRTDIFKHIHIILVIVFISLDVPSHRQLSEESTGKNGAEIAHIHCHHG